MSIARQMGLAVMLALSVTGCAWNTGSLAPKNRPIVAKTALVDVDSFVAEHNRNAEKVRSLVAKPSVTVDARFVGMSPFRGGTEGRLAMERPQNFKLVLEAAGSKKVADLGSNDDEFWFWIPNERDRSVYWCNYADLDRKGVAVPFQPDWIVESMGLKTIGSEESSQIRVKAGPESGTSTLIFPATQVGGETYHRTLVVNNRDRRIKEHRILAADNRSVVLDATLNDYKEYELPERDHVVETCFLADSIRLDWKRERVAFDVKMKDVEINQFSPKQSALLFVKPDMPGYEPRNLAETNRASGREPKTTVRRTIPSPDPRRGTKPGVLAPDSDEAAVIPRLGQTSAGGSRRLLGSSNVGGLPPLPVDTVVGAPMASVPTAADARTAGIMGSQASGLSVER